MTKKVPSLFFIFDSLYKYFNGDMGDNERLKQILSMISKANIQKKLRDLSGDLCKVNAATTNMLVSQKNFGKSIPSEKAS